MKEEKYKINDLADFVKLFDGFSEASREYTQSFRMLEKRLSELSRHLRNHAQVMQNRDGVLTSVLRRLPVGVIVIDLSGKLVFFNNQAEEITGLTADEVVGRDYSDFFSYPVTEPVSALYTLVHGTSIESREKHLIVSGNSNLPVRFSTSWVYDDKGEKIGVLEVLEDLSVLKNLQETVNHRENLAALGEMAAQVAHELRNPLAGVQGFAQFLLEDLSADHSSRIYAEKIISGVKDINFIASRLLEFTSPIHPNFEKVDLIDLIQGECDLIRAEMKQFEGRIVLTTFFPDDTVPVECDPRLLKQVVLNLLKNALHAIKGDGEIQVLVKWDMFRNRVRIIVRDNGIGIAPDQLDKIFSPFFTTRTRGTGLGLALAKKIIDLHNGKIEVVSHRGEGTEFTVELMIARYE